SLRETPLWLTGFAADTASIVREAALKSLGKVDPDLRFPPARGQVLLAALAEMDPESKASARSLLDSALRRDLASPDSDRRRVAKDLLHRLDEPPALRITEVLLVAYNRSSTSAVVLAAYARVATSEPPLIRTAVLRLQAPPARPEEEGIAIPGEE